MIPDILHRQGTLDFNDDDLLPVDSDKVHFHFLAVTHGFQALRGLSDGDARFR